MVTLSMGSLFSWGRPGSTSPPWRQLPTGSERALGSPTQGSLALEGTQRGSLLKSLPPFGFSHSCYYQVKEKTISLPLTITHQEIWWCREQVKGENHELTIHYNASGGLVMQGTMSCLCSGIPLTRITDKFQALQPIWKLKFCLYLLLHCSSFLSLSFLYISPLDRRKIVLQL